ncbi:1,2-phenylacetyl-CoA epoxidase subunit PaaB [Streptomyces humi]
MNTSIQHLSPPSWEVFLRARRGLAHQHVGSVRAVDAGTALEHARDLYTRRGEPLSLWVVRSDSVHAASERDRAAFFSNAQDKPFRHTERYPALAEEGRDGDHGR